MQKKKLRKPKWVILSIMLIMAFGTCFPVSGQPASESIQIEVSGGFDGIAKLGAWSPIHVKVNATGRNITGELQVEASLDQSRKVIVAKPAELTAGMEQEFYFEIPVVSAQRKIQIRLNEGKKTLVEQDFSFDRLLPPEVFLIGVLSDDPEAFGWLNGNIVPVYGSRDYEEKMKLMIAAGQMPTTVDVQAVQDDFGHQRGQAVVVPLDRSSFPDKAEVIEGFDYILINQFDTALLNDAQLSTLETWVDTGGVMMLGTGLNWQKVYHGLPDSLKPFAINGTSDVSCEGIVSHFTGKQAPEMTMKLARGNLGFEYIPPAVEADFDPGTPTRYFDNDIVAGNSSNPLVIKYKKEWGTVLVFTFDPAAEPFVSWQGRVTLFENALKFVSNDNQQRFYERGNGFFQKQNYRNNTLQNLAREVPNDKKPPFILMFIMLGVYTVIAGPILYIVLKKKDKRDWAWVWIPILSVAFLAGMYLFGFQSRYHTAVVNTASLIQVSPEGKEAAITSSIGVFNDRRGTMKLEYDPGNGLATPFVQNDDNYRYYSSNTVEGQVVGKYIIDQPITFEQYDVMLWTPVMLNAQKTIPYGGNVLKGLWLKDGKLQGSIENTSSYDLLDAMVMVGNNLIYVGDILSGDTMPVDIPLDSEVVYKRPDEFLDSVFCRSYYNDHKMIPPDYQEKMQRRSVFDQVLRDIFNEQQQKTQFLLLARNNQAIDYGLEINDDAPQQYYQNLIRMESDFSFQSGQEVEIPAGIIRPKMFQTKEIGWEEGYEGIRVQNTGDMEFQFAVPKQMAVTGFSLSVENYIPLYVRYNMETDQNSNRHTQIVSNQYEYYLYNIKTQSWEAIDAHTTVREDVSRYIGTGNEVRMKVTVAELGQPDESESQPGINYSRYEQELLGMPEISVWGVAK